MRGWPICSAKNPVYPASARKPACPSRGLCGTTDLRNRTASQGRQKMIVKGCCQLSRANETLSASVRLVITRLASGELLALACSGRARHALARYRQRWTIETMFGNLKTKGFALESTHLTNPDKLCTLLALLAFAVALSVKTGIARARLHAIPIKTHGRRAWSPFALGLNTLRKILAAASPDQIIAFLAQLLSPKLPVKPLLPLAF